MPTVRRNFQDANDFVIGKVYALEASTVRQLYDAYAQAFAEITRTMYALGDELKLDPMWKPNDIQFRQELQRQIGFVMNGLDAQTTRILIDNIGTAYTTGYYGAAYTHDVSVGFASMKPALIPMLPQEAVIAQVIAPYLGQSWLDRYQDNRAEFDIRIKRALVQAQILGESMTDARRRIAQELGILQGRKYGVDKQSHRRNFNRTAQIARSEIMRASNNAAVAVYQANDDVLRGWEFKATNDERTCDICGPLDGRMFDFSNKPIDGEGSTSETLPPPVHVNCRCASMPALVNKALEDRVVGKRITYNEWAETRGISRNQSGAAYAMKGQVAPKTVSKGA